MEEQVSAGQFAKKWGLIYGLVTTLINFVPMLLELQLSWLWILNIVVAFVMYILAMRDFKTENGGFMTFGEGFRIAMIAGLIAGVVRNVVIYVYVKFIDPDYGERIQQIMRDAWEEQGLTEEQMDQASRFTSGFTNPEIGLILGIIIVLFGALIWGAISSAIVKNEAEDF